ncbi:MAG: DUF3307 domain-containing protein [Bacteroidales bacterium]|nr:DUF3307 domain-containing protein [Bacteroidales bacterium]
MNTIFESFINTEAIALLIRLLIAHLAGDFIFQKKSWIIHRTAHRWRSGYLYANAGIVAGLSWLLSGYFFIWYLPLLIFVVHFIIDLAKSYAPDSPLVFSSDQALHLAATFLTTWLYLNSATGDVCCSWFFNSLPLWTYFAAYLLVMWPMGIIIALLTRKWQAESETGDGLKDAGRYIGMLERVMILTFIFMGQFSAIGFLVAAKSILRFGDIQDNKNRKGAEYILLGTMISFTAAIFTGLLAQWIINNFA